MMQFVEALLMFMCGFFCFHLYVTMASLEAGWGEPPGWHPPGGDTQI